MPKAVRKSKLEKRSVQEGKMINWAGLEKLRLDLAKPLLIIKARKGFLSGAYLNARVCSRKTKEACAIVANSISYHDMLDERVIEVSDTARALGVRVGMSGVEALERFK